MAECCWGFRDSGCRAYRVCNSRIIRQLDFAVRAGRKVYIYIYMYIYIILILTPKLLPKTPGPKALASLQPELSTLLLL